MTFKYFYNNRAILKHRFECACSFQLRWTPLIIAGLLSFYILIIPPVNAQTLPVPKGYELLNDIQGDLNKDGIKERVLVYNTADTTEDGIVRELQLFKRFNNHWKLWIKNRNTIRKSWEGGMMGDPYEGIEIKNGLLRISFSGGSSWKWNYTDIYRFQNHDFWLIGYTGLFGKLCEYWQTVDFNLITGKIIMTKEFEDCEKDQQVYKRENEIFFKKGVQIRMIERNNRSCKIVSPKYKHQVYL